MSVEDAITLERQTAQDKPTVLDISEFFNFSPQTYPEIMYGMLPLSEISQELSTMLR